MKYLTLILLLIVSCTKTPQLCDAGKVASRVLAFPISQRWLCDQAKLAAFFESKVGPYTCQDPAPQTMVASLAAPSMQQILCPVIISSLVGLGADKIVTDFGCDKAKVILDLAESSKLCSLLNP